MNKFLQRVSIMQSVVLATIASVRPSVSPSVCLLVLERSALSDPYCQSTWTCVGMYVCVRNFEVKYLEIKPRELWGRLLQGAYRKVGRGYRMVTSPMTSRDPMTS